ncbi:MAG: histidine phosphatase family protein, partial [Gammaproteobacteria bacterium]|nr:histidine phosphatase family protein [Gammaproteobacteria bacterium]
MELHLIRHGQTDWNEERRVQGQSESRLTELGIEQARTIGQKLRDLNFDKLFCSSSRRTRETAEHVFAHLDQPITFLDSLREIYLGPWEGRLYDEIEQEDPDSFRHFWHEPHEFNVQGAETFYEMQQRAIKTLLEISQQSFGERVAVISHGALIKSILAHIEALPMEELWKPPLMHNCAHNIIEMREPGTFTITLYADQSFESV